MMPGFLPDTSCMVAAVCAWHEHHTHAAAEIERRLAAGELMCVAAHALVETYSVLTRLPAPHRLSTADAIELLDANFMSAAQIIALDAAAYARLLRDAATSSVAGGQVYDAVIAKSAGQARATTILTFNERHFRPFATASLRIATPGMNPA